MMKQPGAATAAASTGAERLISEKEDDPPVLVIRLYKRRWLMLGLFVLYATTINAQWLQYSIIANIVSRYYNVSAFAVDCTAMSYMLFYVPFIFPAFYLTERLGVRSSLLLGSCASCAAAWIKSLATRSDRFYLTLIGQSLVASTQALMLPVPGRIAAKWFGSNELSTATSFGVLGAQLGIAVSFLLPGQLVKASANAAEVERQLDLLSTLIGLATSFTLLLVGLLFQEDPKLPPSKTRALQKQGVDYEADKGIVLPMRRLLSNRSFLILCNSYGLNIGVLNGLATLFNQLYLMHFENGEEDAGRIGLLMIVTGMAGSVAFGVLLDKTHKFKETTVTVYFLTFCGQILFAVAMFLEAKWMVYLTAGFLGFFMSGYLALGYEMAAEYTYPESESHAAGLLNIANNVYGIGLVVGLSPLTETWGDAPVHTGFCLALLIGLVLTILTPDEQRRQDARKAHLSGFVPVGTCTLEAISRSKPIELL